MVVYVGHNVKVFQLPSDVRMQACDTVAKHPISCACYGSFKMLKNFHV